MPDTKTLAPYQQRVVEDRDELVWKLGNLLAFIGTANFHSLDGYDRALLKQQAELMGEYSRILTKRIERF